MKLLSFGEIMLRLRPVDNLMLKQVFPGRLETSFGGAEANVAFGVANLGGESRFITALPQNQIAEACICQLRGAGVDTGKILMKKGGRIGVYYVEAGSNQRASKVVYDRSNSAVALAESSEYDFDGALDGITRVHVSGITPAISERAKDACLELVKKAFERGISVSCDLNFRNKLWNWREGVSARELARSVMPSILEYVDLVIGNEEDAFDVLGIKSGSSDVQSGQLDFAAYENTAREIAKRFPHVERVAFTLRQSFSAYNNNWGAMLFNARTNSSVKAPVKNGQYTPYEIKNILDRVGGGDSFAAGLIYGLDSGEFSTDADALAFAVANSCLAHSVVGDYNYVSKADVLALMGGSASGRVQR